MTIHKVPKDLPINNSYHELHMGAEQPITKSNPTKKKTEAIDFDKASRATQVGIVKSMTIAESMCNNQSISKEEFIKKLALLQNEWVTKTVKIAPVGV
jgi:hypothetical protein